MRTGIDIAASLCALGLLVASTLTPVRAQRARHDVGARLVVIVSAANRTRSMSRQTVRDIFAGVRTDTPRGDPYVPLAHEWKSALRVAFDRQFLHLEPQAVGRYWVDQRIRAGARPPRTVPSSELAVRIVAALPTAISYVTASDLRAGVVPLRIDDVDFDSPAYPYHVSAALDRATASYASPSHDGSADEARLR